MKQKKSLEIKEAICDALEGKKYPKKIGVELSWDIASGKSITLIIKDKEDIKKFIEYTREGGWPPEVLSDVDDEYLYEPETN